MLSIASVLMIPSDSIDDDAARGLEHEDGDEGHASGFRVLVEPKPLLILAAALLFFHLGNAAMLPSMDWPWLLIIMPIRQALSL